MPMHMSVHMSVHVVHTHVCTRTQKFEEIVAGPDATRYGPIVYTHADTHGNPHV